VGPEASWEALGTSVVLRLGEPVPIATARSAVERELDAIDAACSRFRADSELTRLNGRSGNEVVVSSLLLEALALALRAAELTGGDVDPTVGVALELAGYDRDWRLLPPPPAGGTALEEPPPAPRLVARSAWRRIRLDPLASSVRVPVGVRLDLGATAKAWAADRAARAAAEAGGCGALVALGGDVATSGPAPAGGWHVRVTDDHRSGPDAEGQTVTIRGGGLATSSTAVRRWGHRGATMHHIIDPASGTPVRSVWRTVSAAAASCADANIATTAALVRAGAAAEWLARTGLPARLVDGSGRVRVVGAWPAAQVARAAAPGPTRAAAGVGAQAG
jgi:thiamine biosynthesis lipoprotein